MSEPIKLPKSYGEIPEQPTLKKMCTADPKELAEFVKDGLKDLAPDTAGTIDLPEDDSEWFIDKFKVKPIFHAIPIKDAKNSVKGWLVHDITDKDGKALFPNVNLMILKRDDSKEFDVFFTEYGQSFRNDKVAEKHLSYDDAEKIKAAMYTVDLYVSTLNRTHYAPAFSFFSRRLAELGQDKRLTRLRKLLQYCSDPAFLPNDANQSGKLTTELRAILPNLIKSYENATKPDDERRLILLKAIDQQIRRRVEPNLPLGPQRKLSESEEKSHCLSDLLFSSHHIKESVQCTEKAKKDLKGRAGEKARCALAAIERYEDCLTAIYAKDAEQTLQTDDVTCFEILAHKMRMAAYGCLDEKKQKYLKIEEETGLPDPSRMIAADSLTGIAASCQSVCSQHLVEAKKYHADDLMYRWALQHAEEMGVPVGPYEKLDDNLYKRLSEVAKVDDPGTLLKSLDEQRCLKDSNLVGQRKNQISSIKKLQIKTSRDNGANAKGKTEGEVRKGKSNVFRSQISVNYLSKNSFMFTLIALTAPQENACHVPDDKILLEMAGQAYWRSRNSKNLINAVKNKTENRREYAVKYLIYKLKLKDYDEEDTEGSLEKLKERTILGKDLAQLDRPSMAKVILAAKVCGVKIDKDSQLRLNQLLQEPHVPSLFR